MSLVDSLVPYTKRLRLLYVEDNPDVRQSTLLVLREFFSNIIVAEDGKRGLELFRQQRADLIITDINMPHMDGIEMIEKIRAIDPEVPVIIISAYNESGYFIQSIRLGVDGYLLKPVELDQLLALFKKVADKIRLKEEAASSLNLLRQYQEATDKSAIVSKADPKGLITYVNDAFCKVSGYTKEELIGKPHNILRHPDSPKELFENIWRTISIQKRSWKGILKNRSKSGQTYYIETLIKPILDINQNILEYISIGHDITHIMNPKKQLEDLLESAKELLLVLIKIENFEDIEHYYGISIARAIEEAFQKEIERFAKRFCWFERIFALGEGEFVLAKKLIECVDHETVIRQIERNRHKLQNIRIEIDGFAYDVSALISIAAGQESFQNARYGMKLLQKENIDFIVASDLSQHMQEVAKTNLKTLGIIKDAVENNRILLYAQPIIDNRSFNIVKHEVLLRLVTAEGEILSPYLFLDVAKRSRYYVLLTRILFEKIFEAMEHFDVELSVNLSMLDIENLETRKLIFDLIQHHSDLAPKLTFELLEDEEMRNFKRIKSFIKYVKSMGVKIAIDDFGSGYSNFERLMEFEPDILKIDGTLIKDIDTNPFAFDMVETINRFAKRQNIKTVAEFVENEKIFEVIHALGIDYSQGYYFFKPQPLEV